MFSEQPALVTRRLLAQFDGATLLVETLRSTPSGGASSITNYLRTSAAPNSASRSTVQKCHTDEETGRAHPKRPGPAQAVVAMSYRFLAIGARDRDMRYRLSWLLAFLVGALASTAEAADIAKPPASSTASGWIITIGGDVRDVPKYMGSDASRVTGALFRFPPPGITRGLPLASGWNRNCPVRQWRICDRAGRFVDLGAPAK